MLVSAGTIGASCNLKVNANLGMSAVESYKWNSQQCAIRTRQISLYLSQKNISFNLRRLQLSQFQCLNEHIK